MTDTGRDQMTALGESLGGKYAAQAARELRWESSPAGRCVESGALCLAGVARSANVDRPPLSPVEDGARAATFKAWDAKGTAYKELVDGLKRGDDAAFNATAQSRRGALERVYLKLGEDHGSVGDAQLLYWSCYARRPRGGRGSSDESRRRRGRKRGIFRGGRATERDVDLPRGPRPRERRRPPAGPLPRRGRGVRRREGRLDEERGSRGARGVRGGRAEHVGPPLLEDARPRGLRRGALAAEAARAAARRRAVRRPGGIFRGVGASTGTGRGAAAGGYSEGTTSGRGLALRGKVNG